MLDWLSWKEYDEIKIFKSLPFWKIFINVIDLMFLQSSWKLFKTYWLVGPEDLTNLLPPPLKFTSPCILVYMYF